MGKKGVVLREDRTALGWALLPLRFVYSMAVWGTGLFSMLLGFTLCVVCSPFVSFSTRQTYLATPGMAMCVRLTGSRINVHFHPDFDPKRPSVFAQNHVNLLDGHLACAVIPQCFCGLMEAWHFKVPIYGWIMRLTQGIAVYPHKAGRTEEITTAAKDRSGRGISILVFPEGHRTLDGKVRPFKRGVFFMARDAEIPVVPIAVRGFFDVNRKGSVLFKPGRIDVFVGPQLETNALDDDGVTALTRRTQKVISAWVEHGERAI